MPNFKKDNLGFGYIPILVLSALVLTGGYLGYSYYSSNSNQNQSNQVANATPDTSVENDEDVLQANVGDFPGNARDINSFLFQNLFGVRNAGEFNSNMSPLLVGADNKFSNCIFLPRASKPVNVNFEYSGRRLSARIYSSVAYHVLPKNVSGKYLVVSINNAGDIKFSNNFPPITNSCGQGVFIFNQPSEEVTAQKFLNMIVQQSNTSENIQIAISRSPSRTIFSVRPENNKVVISQTVINNFRNSGVKINSTQKINVIYCSGDCSKGFTVAVPLGSAKDAQQRKISSAEFPMLPNQRIDVAGTGKCRWNKTNDNTITFDYCTTGNDGNYTDIQP